MDMRITLKQMEIFCAVVVSGSITNASRRTGLSQPSISQQLAKFEESLGSQLIERNRAGHVSLTSTGEFWYKTATDLLHRYESAMQDHAARFSGEHVSVRLGTTPTLRGRFSAAVARIALNVDPQARFYHYWGLNSGEVVERLRMHQLNFALVDVTSLEQEMNSYSLSPMFRDTMAWIVPRDIPVAALRDALQGASRPFEDYPALTRYVALGAEAPMQPGTDDWYRHHFPPASPVFGAMTYVSAVDLAAEGLATAHCPLSMLPNVPSPVRDNIRWLKIDGFGRDVVLAMPKHLQSLSTYARIQSELEDFAQARYSPAMSGSPVTSFDDLL